MLIVEIAKPSSPGPRALLEQSHAMMRDLFPPEDNYFLDLEELCGPDIRFYAARDGAETLGTGALALKRGYAEVKSMFTSEAARGRGVAAAILRALEDEARGEDITVLRLETAEALDAAIRLYERHGFARRGIFGDYRPNATSVFMEKILSPVAVQNG
ncbi:putative N-acetyltransferase YsnE [Roseovarius sp. THAF9]|uniref:GNAT family N-acetyltransferase n=1 Tax=Roseovarius sp. THAF9 TaxID=2587847 RepID=UPI00126959CF|nr:GNAT family N-acetyltransferase [Roseovarius sp. THAF9]QFT94552.1 putative N-acetyltransferase YsnE [Roseovarius sp. THAF9]